MNELTENIQKAIENLPETYRETFAMSRFGEKTNVQIAEKKAELTDLQQQISVVEIQSQYLKKVQNYKGDDLKKYIEKIAKDELGYVGDGERIFINVAGE